MQTSVCRPHNLDRNMQAIDHNMQTTICLSQYEGNNMQSHYADHNMQATICIPQYAGHNMHTSVCRPQYAGRTMGTIICRPHYADNNMQTTICLPTIQTTLCRPHYAGHNVQGKTAHEIKAQWHSHCTNRLGKQTVTANAETEIVTTVEETFPINYSPFTLTELEY